MSGARTVANSYRNTMGAGKIKAHSEAVSQSHDRVANGKKFLTERDYAQKFSVPIKD